MGLKFLIFREIGRVSIGWRWTLNDQRECLVQRVTLIVQSH